MKLLDRIFGVSITPDAEIASHIMEHDIINEEAIMPKQIIELEEIQDNKGGDKCYPRPNLCNDMVYQFGRNTCVHHPFIPVPSNNTIIGVAVNPGKVTHVKIVWKGRDVKEVLVLTKNGCPIEWIAIDGDEGTKCVAIKEYFGECDVLNIMEAPFGVRSKEDEGDDEKCGDFRPACEINIAVEYSRKCHIRFRPEGDGIAEAVKTDGLTNVVNPNIWYTAGLDFERTNTLPSYISFIDAEDAFELRHGKYKINFGAGIEFQKSVSLEYHIQLQTNDGSGWVDYPYSIGADAILFGQGQSNVTADRTVTMEIPYNDTMKIRIVEQITDDTYIVSSGAGAYIVVERIDKGIRL